MRRLIVMLPILGMAALSAGCAAATDSRITPNTTEANHASWTTLGADLIFYKPIEWFNQPPQK